MSPAQKVMKTLFGKYLFVTNTVTSSVCMGVGDFIEQNCAWNNDVVGIDWQRIGKMLVVGLCLGPTQHFFYKCVDGRYTSNTMKSAFKKIIIEQSVNSPLFISGFYLISGILEGRQLSDSYDELKEKFWKVYKIDCMIWPPTQFINFFYLSAKYRMLYVNSATVIYDVMLSFFKNQDKKRPEELKSRIHGHST